MTEEQVQVQKKNTMLLYCWLIGWTGIHRKMMGYQDWWKHLLLTFLCGIGGIMGFIDLIKIFQDKLPMADGRPLEQ
jgi:TM2 domain-containing membrane protein YozV